MPDFSYENEKREQGYKFVCGIDEAGRGPLAGPVCAAAVILPPDLDFEGVNDSKKLSEKKREMLYEEITEKAISWSVAFASVNEIEEHNILGATYIAMQRAVESLKVPADFALIDGNRTPPSLKIPSLTVVKGDSKSLSIAAASIIAKVTRDRLLLEYDAIYPQYKFSQHKGYGTKVHIEAIREFGPCDIHRPSFIKNFIK
ncbi:MAG: ribonuclease HII [Ruminococcaceae bacterium]|nr:ribonuclease HII [Oscillospiraceae bacterium]